VLKLCGVYGVYLRCDCYGLARMRLTCWLLTQISPGSGLFVLLLLLLLFLLSGCFPPYLFLLRVLFTLSLSVG